MTRLKIFTLPLLAMLLSLPVMSISQNLILNGDFEDLVSCPDDHGQIDRAQNWSNPSRASPDLYNRCAGSGPCVTCVPTFSQLGFQQPQSGDGYAGMFTQWISSGAGNYREYMRGQLAQPLVANQAYEFTMYVNFADVCEVATEVPQVHFSSDDYSSGSTLGFFNVTPQINFDTLITDRFSWVKLTACYVAEGGEQFITIGNFEDDANTRQLDLGSNDERNPYYIIDNLSLIPIEDLIGTLLPDTILFCEGDTVNFNLPSNFQYLWNDGYIGNNRDIFRTGTYIVRSTSLCLMDRADTMYARFDDQLDLSLPDTVFICENGSILLQPGGQIDSWLWSDGSTADTFLITQEGLIWVEASNKCGTVRDSVYATFVPDPKGQLPNDTFFCEGDSLWLFADPEYNPVWEGNVQSDSFLVKSAGTIVVELSNFCDLVAEIIRIRVLPRPKIDFGQVTPFCEGDSVRIAPVMTGFSWQWTDGFTDSVRWIKNEGWVGIEAIAECGTITDSIFVSTIPLPASPFKGDTVLCMDETWQISIPNEFDVMWSDGSTANQYTIDQTGEYWVEVTNMCGSIRDTIRADFIEPPQAYLGQDTTLCMGDTLVLTYNGPDSWQWQSGSSDPDFEISNEGNYYIEVSNACGHRRDSIAVGFDEMPTLNLPDSVKLCEGDQITITPTSNQSSWIWHDGSTTQDFNVISNGIISASTRNACGLASDSTFVDLDLLPYFDFLSPDQNLCAGDTIFLSATSPNGTIMWTNNPGSGQELLVNASGNYEVQSSNACGDSYQEVIIQVEDCGCDVYVPNVFTPNGDNINDVLEYFAACELEDVKMTIFSRWGELIFQNTAETPLWNGTFNGQLLPPDVFVYNMTYAIGELTFIKSGSVTLLR